MTNIKSKLDNLVKNKLAIVKHYEEDGFSIYKYSKTVFFKNLWHKDNTLLKARGIVLDRDGNIVQNPFDKVFNFNENGTGSTIDENKEVIAVEKLNGFLGCITKHPNKNELLISTTGSLTSDFVIMIKDLIDEKLNKKLLDYLSVNNVTLMFEVIHPGDPHIIPYEKSEQGLWLIGCKEKYEEAKNKKENELDVIAQKIDCKRPYWFKDTFKNILNKVKTEKIEGYMVLDEKTQETLLKIKTDYYLTTKFLGRMGNKNIEMMFENTKVFKEKVEEEFFELIDDLIKMDKETLLNMNNDEKVVLIRNKIDFLNSLRKNEEKIVRKTI